MDVNLWKIFVKFFIKLFSFRSLFLFVLLYLAPSSFFYYFFFLFLLLLLFFSSPRPSGSDRDMNLRVSVVHLYDNTLTEGRLKVRPRRTIAGGGECWDFLVKCVVIVVVVVVVVVVLHFSLTSFIGVKNKNTCLQSIHISIFFISSFSV